MNHKDPNQPAASNAGIASRLTDGPPCPGGPEPVRWCTRLVIKKVIILLALIIMGVSSLWLWPSPRYDLTRVHPSLRELNAPYQSVFTSFVMDGGSIGVRIVDRDGRLAEFALPISAGAERTYPKLFVGATHASKANAVEVPFTEDTRLMLISVIDAHRNPADSSDLALLNLRGLPRDHARIWGHVVVNLYRRVVP